MTTIVNNPPQSSDSSGSGVLIGVIVLVILGVALWYWVIPMMNKGTTQINVPAPQINVPSQVDVNVNQTE